MPSMRNTEGIPLRTNEYWSERTKIVSSGNGSGLTSRPSSAAAYLMIGLRLECSSPQAMMSPAG